MGGTPKVMSGAAIGPSDESRQLDGNGTTSSAAAALGAAGHPAFRGHGGEHLSGGDADDSPYPERHHHHHDSSAAAAPTEAAFYDSRHGGHHHHGHEYHDHHHHHEGLFYRRRCKSESVLNFSRPVDEEMLVAAAWRLRHRRWVGHSNIFQTRITNGRLPYCREATQVLDTLGFCHSKAITGSFFLPFLCSFIGLASRCLSNSVVENPWRLT